jgi:hypothetical protein
MNNDNIPGCLYDILEKYIPKDQLDGMKNFEDLDNYCTENLSEKKQEEVALRVLEYHIDLGSESINQISSSIRRMTQSTTDFSKWLKERNSALPEINEREIKSLKWIKTSD